MEQIAISKFKATCSSVLEQVRRTGRRVLVTRFGEPFVEIVPYRPPRRMTAWIGSLAGSGQIIGDIVTPAGDEHDWESG